MLASRLGSRLTRCIVTLPTARGWLEAALTFAVFGLLALPIAIQTGLMTFSPSDLPLHNLLLLVGIAVFSPSLLEESLYRGLLLPDTAQTLSLGWYGWVGLSLSAYVLAHPLVAWLLWPWARPIFYDPAFLLIVLLLGLCCTFIRLRSGSIWPAVLIHWLTVASWKLFFGGPDFNLA